MAKAPIRPLKECVARRQTGKQGNKGRGVMKQMKQGRIERIEQVFNCYSKLVFYEFLNGSSQTVE